MAQLQALSMTDLIAQNPAINANHASPKMSDKYSFINTKEVLDLFNDQGWVPVSARGRNPRKAEKKDYAKHCIRLRQSNDLGMKQVNDILPEIVLENSHDGLSRLNVSVGLFRVFCANQAVVKSQEFANIHLRHMGLDAREITGVIRQVISNFKQLMKNVDEYKTIQLSKDEQIELARKAIHIRWNDNAPAIQAEKLLECRRVEDQSDDLWTVWNRVQENILKGGAKYEMINKKNKVSKRKIRAIRGMDADLKINKQLWMVLESIKYSKTVSV